MYAYKRAKGKTEICIHIVQPQQLSSARDKFRSKVVIDKSFCEENTAFKLFVTLAPSEVGFCVLQIQHKFSAKVIYHRVTAHALPTPANMEIKQVPFNFHSGSVCEEVRLFNVSCCHAV